MPVLLYILGTGSKWHNNELRYSLRSVAMHGLNYSGVAIVGECPEWVTGVAHIPAHDIYETKADNTLHKLRVAVMAMPGTDFVLMNDDFFLIQPYDFSNMPMYYSGSIEQLLERYKRNSPYKQVQQNTVAVLQAAGKPTRNYALHYPMALQAHRLNATLQSMAQAPALSFRNVYGNIEPNDNESVLPDTKIDQYCICEYEIHQQIAGAPFFSIGDRFLNATGIAFLKKQYQKPSKYEK